MPMSTDWLAHIPPRAISLDFVEAGQGMMPDGYVHCKCVPYTILAQAIEGRYELASPMGTVVTEAGEAFLVGANVPLQILHHGASSTGQLRARWLHCHATLYGTIDLLSLFALPPKINARTCAPFVPLIEELYTLQASGSAAGLGGVFQRQALACQALGVLCALAPLRTDSLAMLERLPEFSLLFTYIREHLASPLTIRELAELVSLSPSRFHVRFKTVMGISPMAYVARVRVEEAWRRVARSSESLRAIACATGFCSEFHLSRAFKTAFGQSPRAFRKTREHALA
jgi:AraC-like DNA-binding protein